MRAWILASAFAASLFATFLTPSAHAVPRGVAIVPPDKIEVVGQKLKLTFKLACTGHVDPREWAGNLIWLSDDEGDYAFSIGVVMAKSSCDPGKPKNFVFEYDMKKEGFPDDILGMLNDITFEPMDVSTKDRWF